MNNELGYDPRSVLWNAELCWRSYRAFSLRFALARDLLNQYPAKSLVEYRHILLMSSQIVQIDSFCLMLERTDQLISNNTIVESARSLLGITSYATVNFELAKMAGIEKQFKLYYAKESLVGGNHSIRVSHELIDEKYGRCLSWPYKSRINEIVQWEKKKTFTFTPFLCMGIGHYYLLLDLIKILTSISSSATLRVYLPKFGVGKELLYAVMNDFPSRFEILDTHSVYKEPIENLSSSYDCDFHCSWVSNSCRICVEETIKHKRPPSKEVSIIVHLRTDNYKNDGHHPTQTVRSVDPKSYQLTINKYNKIGVDFRIVTADSNAFKLNGAHHHHVYNLKSALKQWRYYKNADALLGTASGISHLSFLCDYKALLTNFTSLTLEFLLSPMHLFACKKVTTLKPSLLRFAPLERLILYASPWELDGGLGEHIEFTPLSEKDIEKAFAEFLDFYLHNKKPHSIQDLLSKRFNTTKLTFLPIRYLTKSCYVDLLNILTF